MFQQPFSFEGRIRRTEYGLSILINSTIWVFLSLIIEGASMDEGAAFVVLLAWIPMLWFSWAQGAKRCHDLGNSGWWQLIPFYGLWLLFQDGAPGPNQYGENPKAVPVHSSGYTSGGNQNSSYGGNASSGGYSGGYSGGHNNPGASYSAPVTNYTSGTSNRSEGGYKDGELYK